MQKTCVVGYPIPGIAFLRVDWASITYIIEAEWRIYASLDLATIGSDNGLLPHRHQAIICTDAAILLIGP